MGPVKIAPHEPSVVVKTSKPIRSKKKKSKIGHFGSFFGFLMVLHTPVWIMMAFTKDDIDPTAEAELASLPMGKEFLTRWVLEFTPWFANAVLCVFLGILFFVLGFAHMVFEEVT